MFTTTLKDDAFEQGTSPNLYTPVHHQEIASLIREFPIPYCLRHCKVLSNNEIAILNSLINDFCHSGSTWTGIYPSHARLAKVNHMCRKTVGTALKRLKKLNFINWKRRYRTSNAYTVTDKIFEYHPRYLEALRQRQNKHLQAQIDHDAPVNLDELFDPTKPVRFNAVNCVNFTHDSIVKILKDSRHSPGGERQGKIEFDRDLSEKKKRTLDQEAMESFLKDLENMEKLEEEREKDSAQKEKEREAPPTPTPTSSVTPSLTVAMPTPTPTSSANPSLTVVMPKPTPKVWFKTPSDDDFKDFILRDTYNGVDRAAIESVHKTFLASLKARELSNLGQNLEPAEYFQVADMISTLGLHASQKLMQYVVKNWSDLTTSCYSQYDDKKLSLFPNPAFNPILATWRWKMWHARMSGVYSIRTEKRRKKKALEKVTITEVSQASLINCFVRV